MDSAALLVLLSFVLWTIFHVLRLNSRSPKSSKLPPGPYRYPIIGNILKLGQNPHISLAKLSKTYGPLLFLKLGAIETVVVSSPEIAKEVLQKHDQTLSGRPTLDVVQVLDHASWSVVWLAPAEKWRVHRRICKEQMFSTQRLESSRSLRSEKLNELWNYVNHCSMSGQTMDIGEAVFVTSLNLISNTLFSVNFAGYDLSESHEIKETVKDMMTLAGTPNFADYFPLLKYIDPQGIKRQAKVYCEQLFKEFDHIIDERLQSRGKSIKHDLLEALLDLCQGKDSDFTREDMKHLLLDLFVAGTETTSSTLEWAMTELMRNPAIMSKLRNELRDVLRLNQHIEESDISRLPYLQAVIKEVFRFHPVTPFLVPHKAEVDTEVNGHTIPKDAQILVNIWATSRDYSIWKNADLFQPERFLIEDVKFIGQDFRLIPFGGGRRTCPGMPLAYRMVHLIVATLVHNFDWKLENGMRPEELDITEKFGISLQKALPLKAIPIKL